MVTLAVAAVLLVIAVPSFLNLILTNRLVTTTNEMVTAINTARMEAVKRNAGTQFCSDNKVANTNDTLGTACGTAAGAVYAITAGVAAPVLASTSGLTPPLLLSGNMVALRFNSQGVGSQASAPNTPYTGTVAVLCASAFSDNNRYTISMTNGTIVEVNKSTGLCP
jgi:type IV fimbrial biogenesis protein FimT